MSAIRALKNIICGSKNDMNFDNWLRVTCMMKIVRNMIRCKKCRDVIESCTVHDFKFCSCGSCAVDGGHEYLRRCGNPEDWEELSETQSVDDWKLSWTRSLEQKFSGKQKALDLYIKGQELFAKIMLWRSKTVKARRTGVQLLCTFCMRCANQWLRRR